MYYSDLRDYLKSTLKALQGECKFNSSMTKIGNNHTLKSNNLTIQDKPDANNTVIQKLL